MTRTMTYPLIGHEENLQQFQQRLERQRLASTYLLAGPEGIGKRRFAQYIAQCLLCEKTPENALESCDDCPACQQVIAGTHPDLLQVRRPADKNYLPIELLIGERDQRMRAGLCHDIALKPFRGGRRIAIIDDADYLNQEGANCLLKTLEEPPPRSVLFLITSSEHRQLPTIRSRAQIVRFRGLSAEQVQQILEQNDWLSDSQQAATIAQASGGSVTQALLLAQPEVFDFRQQWLTQLATLDPGRNSFFETMGQFIDGAGKEASLRRNRFRSVVDIAITFYRNLLTRLSGYDENWDASMNRAVEDAVGCWSGDSTRAGNAVERCHRVLQEITANANQSLTIEVWLSDLGRICRGEWGEH